LSIHHRLVATFFAGAFAPADPEEACRAPGVGAGGERYAAVLEVLNDGATVLANETRSVQRATARSPPIVVARLRSVSADASRAESATKQLLPLSGFHGEDGSVVGAVGIPAAAEQWHAPSSLQNVRRPVSSVARLLRRFDRQSAHANAVITDDDDRTIGEIIGDLAEVGNKQCCLAFGSSRDATSEEDDARNGRT